MSVSQRVILSPIRIGLSSLSEKGLAQNGGIKEACGAFVVTTSSMTMVMAWLEKLRITQVTKEQTVQQAKLLWWSGRQWTELIF